MMLIGCEIDHTPVALDKLFRRVLGTRSTPYQVWVSCIFSGPARGFISCRFVPGRCTLYAKVALNVASTAEEKRRCSPFLPLITFHLGVDHTTLSRAGIRNTRMFHLS